MVAKPESDSGSLRTSGKRLVPQRFGASCFKAVCHIAGGVSSTTGILSDCLLKRHESLFTGETVWSTDYGLSEGFQV
jgi:hypothetical protein